MEHQSSDEEELKLDSFVRAANKAAAKAGEILRKYYYSDREALKSFDKVDADGCIVEQSTNADIEAEQAIVSVLLAEFPHHVVYGEESGWSPPDQSSDYVWVIDPIDGTTSFKNGVPLFGTLIALLYKNEPIIGIIDSPIVRDRWVGVRGRKTTRNGSPVDTRKCDYLSSATLYTSSTYHFTAEELEAFNRVTDRVFKEAQFGAECFTYGLLASGYVDLLIQSFLGAYDFLAFIPIIEGAGGVITDWRGQKLEWEASPLFQAPEYYRIIAAGDKRVHQEALQYIKQ